MNFRGLLLAFAGAGALAAADPSLNQVRHVYVLPMSGGFDQHLAHHITREGRYVVVTDPAQADALLTDRLGPVFEETLKELYPPPPKEAPAEEPQAAKEENMTLAAMGEAAGSVVRSSSFSRGKGNVFLVHRGTRQVLWSTYLRPRSTRPDELNRAADKIIDRLDDAAEKGEKRMSRLTAPPVSPVAPPAPVAPAAPAAPPAASPQPPAGTTPPAAK